MNNISFSNMCDMYYSACKLLLVCSILCFSTFFINSPSNAAENVFEEEKKEVKQGITKYRINIRRLQQGIKLQQQEVEKSLKKERDLLAEIEDIDMRLQGQLEKISVLNERMINQENLISLKERELDRSKSERNAVKEHLKSRINAYYKTGRIGVINVAFSTQTFPELLKFHDSYQYLMRYDKTVIDTYRHTISELENAKKSLLLEQTLLKDFVQQAVDEKEKTTAILQEKDTLLSHIKTQTDLHKQAMLEMEKAARDLTSSLTVLESKEKFLEQGFLLHKGQILAPIQGKVITKYGEMTNSKMGIRKKSAGISINASEGSKIRAPYDGRVIFAGYHRGYGNTVIIHHGFKYFTITSRIEKIVIKKGEKVKTGDLIGLAGKTAMLIEDGVYLEIRKEKNSMDPLDWLDHKNLIISEF